MRLSALHPSVTPWPELGPDLHRLRFDCPTCAKPIEIAIRIGLPQHVPMAWGASSLDVESMSVVPSIANPRHGRVLCAAHFTVDAGVINIR